MMIQMTSNRYPWWWPIEICQKIDEERLCKIPPGVRSKIGKNLHLSKGHPLSILKEHIYKFSGFCNWVQADEENEIVSIHDNFDALLIPPEHPARRPTDTFYVDDHTVLRTHMTTHQIPLLRKILLSEKKASFLATGPVYRKDNIDAFHYPVFHQVDGALVVIGEKKSRDPRSQAEVISDFRERSKANLLKNLSQLLTFLFPTSEIKFEADYFPFTDPSIEAQVKSGDTWIELLGGGVIRPEILSQIGIVDLDTVEEAWAFGLGLERLAMHMFHIPDIRYFWNTEEKFLQQFSDAAIQLQSGKLPKAFQQYSKLQPVYRDISFWIPSQELILTNPPISPEMSPEDQLKIVWPNVSSFYEAVRLLFADKAQAVQVLDMYPDLMQSNPKQSVTFRLHLLPSDSSCSNPAALSCEANKGMVLLIEHCKALGFTMR